MFDLSLLIAAVHQEHQSTGFLLVELVLNVISLHEMLLYWKERVNSQVICRIVIPRHSKVKAGR